MSRSAVQAAVRAHYYADHPAYRPRPVISPPRQVERPVGTLDPEAEAALAGIGLQLASEIDRAKAVEDQLSQLEDIWRERFEAVVQPIAECVKEAVAEALQSFADELRDSAGVDDAAEPDEQTSSGWIATRYCFSPACSLRERSGRS